METEKAKNRTLSSQYQALLESLFKIKKEKVILEQRLKDILKMKKNEIKPQEGPNVSLSDTIKGTKDSKTTKADDSLNITKR